MYQYTSLPQRGQHFRLLQLQSAPPNISDFERPDGTRDRPKIYGRIIVVNLDDNPEYDALSYCWQSGDQPSTSKEKHQIHLTHPDDAHTGGICYIPINQALVTALHHLVASGPSLPLFIDQICINQSDMTERSSQVRLMGEIYGRCATVIAWLGPSSADLNSVFDFVPRVEDCDVLRKMFVAPERQASLITAIVLPKSNIGIDESVRSDVERMIQTVKREWSNFPYRGFVQMCCNRWFSRVWIIQEACLGPDVQFICGDRRCTIKQFQMVMAFSIVAHTMETSGLVTLPENRGRDAFVGQYHFQTASPANCILEQRRAVAASRASGNPQPSLAEVVVRFSLDGPFLKGSQSFNATEPHDHIYGLLGLANKDDAMVRDLVVDYAATPEKVFTEFTRLAATADIDILLFSQMERKSPKLRNLLPTWVPDWSSFICFPPGYLGVGSSMFSAGRKPGQTREVSSLQPPGNPGNPRCLTAEGLWICETNQVGERWMERRQESVKPAPTLETVLPFFVEVQTLLGSVRLIPAPSNLASVKELDQAVWLTCTGGQGLTMSYPPGNTVFGDQNMGRPLLGHLWNARIRQDAGLLRMKWRTAELERLAAVRSAGATTRAQLAAHGAQRYLVLFSKLSGFIGYWARRVRVEIPFAVSRAWFFVASLWTARSASDEDRAFYRTYGVIPDKRTSSLDQVLYMHARRVCFTSSAGHVGLGPVGMQPGDVVVVLKGSTSPMILRPGAKVADSYKYIGEAYCYGFMHECLNCKAERLELLGWEHVRRGPGPGPRNARVLADWSNPAKDPAASANLPGYSVIGGPPCHLVEPGKGHEPIRAVLYRPSSPYETRQTIPLIQELTVTIWILAKGYGVRLKGLKNHKGSSALWFIYIMVAPLPLPWPPKGPFGPYSYGSKRIE
ncbi:heterokaryon incompatibility protein-domain-containing protein [Podospora didyma]|uniref:Heterokaryon incompatibility protein-domain-containing protein n=1 Tax=Podospora didyma TaxID=330526 RepID=A0AAE0U130_9PEZI|nr:heterokaryon incompatibility protein-domain-containing protein [Podospora didyma]